LASARIEKNGNDRAAAALEFEPLEECFFGSKRLCGTAPKYRTALKIVSCQGVEAISGSTKSVSAALSDMNQSELHNAGVLLRQQWTG
jgi:hypothetical protein